MPYTPSAYIREPYVRPSLPQRDRRLGDLLRLRGANAAEAELRRGDISANMWANIGNAIQGSISNYQSQVERDRDRKEREGLTAQTRESNALAIENQRLELGERKREQAGQAFERSMLPLALKETENGIFTYDRGLLKQEFEQAGMGDRLPGVFKGLDDADAAMQRVNQAKADTFAGLAYSALQIGATPEAFQEALTYARENDLAGERHLQRYAEQATKNPQAIPDMLFSIASMSPEYAELLQPEKPLVLDEGDKAIDPRSGMTIAQGNPKTPTGRPVPVMGPDGRVIYMRPDQAAGMPVPPPSRAPERPGYQWVTRDGEQMEIPRGSAQPGDLPFVPSSRGAGAAGGYSDQMPPAVQNTLDRAILSVPGTRRGPIVALANRLAEAGNLDGLKDVIRQAAIEGENVDTKNQVLGRQATMASLRDTRAILEEMHQKGVPTSFLRGTVEDVARRLGKTTNPEYVALANRLMGTLINYRRAATGVAFGMREQADYARMFPNYKNDLPVNLALIEGLEREMTTYDREYWTHKLGAGGAELVGVVTPDAPDNGGTVEMIAPDGGVLDVPAADVERMKALGATVKGR